MTWTNLDKHSENGEPNASLLQGKILRSFHTKALGMAFAAGALGATGGSALAQSVVCTSTSSRSDCDVTAHKSGRHVFQSTATSNVHEQGASMWLEVTINGQQCGKRVTVGISGYTGAVSHQCGAKLTKGKSYKLQVLAGNTKATATGVSLNVVAVDDDLEL